MALVVKHNSTADGDPLIDGDDWNANHTLTGGGVFKLPQLVEEAEVNITQNVPVTISDLDGNTDEEYFLEFYLDSTNAATILIAFNEDTNTNYYTTRIQLQESDGDHHLTNWVNSRTIGRVYSASPYISRGRCNIFNIPSYGVHLIGHIAMFGTGFGEVSTHYIPSSFSNLTSISLSTSDNVTIVGNMKLYKMVDLTI